MKIGFGFELGPKVFEFDKMCRNWNWRVSKWKKWGLAPIANIK
jgi:hypothetical protein